eukprot:3934889-Rhodomonas_salina.2
MSSGNALTQRRKTLCGGKAGEKSGETVPPVGQPGRIRGFLNRLPRSQSPLLGGSSEESEPDIGE